MDSVTRREAVKTAALFGLSAAAAAKPNVLEATPAGTEQGFAVAGPYPLDEVYQGSRKPTKEDGLAGIGDAAILKILKGNALFVIQPRTRRGAGEWRFPDGETGEPKLVVTGRLAHTGMDEAGEEFVLQIADLRAFDKATKAGEDREWRVFCVGMQWLVSRHAPGGPIRFNVDIDEYPVAYDINGLKHDIPKTYRVK